MRRHLLALVVLVAVPAGAQPADPLSPVREAFLRAVEQESAIPEALQAIEAVRAGERAPPPGSGPDAVLAAYRGSLITLRARHGSWPPARLAHLRSGLAVLDSVVAAHPDEVEVRYLRLMSCYYLPRVLGRAWSVREDVDALAGLLTDGADGHTPELRPVVIRFLLESGRLSPQQRRALVPPGPGG